MTTPIRVQTLTAAAVLAQPGGDPLIFDNTLDGLRGVPITDLTTCQGSPGERMLAAGINTVYDVVTRVPLRYIDRTQLYTIDQLRPGMGQVAVVSKVVSTKRFIGAGPGGGKGRARGMAHIVIGHTARRITCTLFNQGWQANRFKPGDPVLVVGEVTVYTPKNGGRAQLQMTSPSIEPYDPAATAPLVPMYPQAERHQVTTWQIGRAAVEACRRINTLDDPVPAPLLEELMMPTRIDALRAVHVPESAAAAKEGRDRLAFDELLRLQLALGVRRAGQRELPAVTHRPTGELTDAYLLGLPWPLTGAQTRATAEIRADLTAKEPMNRILQGEVGSGKTGILALTALAAIEGGHQAALMAPTEILAMQHYQEMVQHLTGIGVVVGLLAARQGAKARRETLTALADGTIQLVVGTHSLLVDEVKFASLGLVLVDEQHRFGVEQRAKMMGKGPNGATPDLLVATATPIPRTAALSAFGDLDMSVLDEMPPGRTPIDTWHHKNLDLQDPADRAWALVRDQVVEGRQAYVVCPMVAESEKAQAAAAEQTLESLRSGALRGLRLGLASGKQPSAERSAIMADFTAGDLDVLVATTVIEVGVNVPNSTVIVILDSARFGLAQLHQLRGRVGRGSHPGHCVLAGDPLTEVGEARIMAMCNSTDGFVLSEIDMQLRGPGALAGVAQAGKNIGMAVADLLKDTDLMLKARDVARTILVSDPKLGRRPTLRHEVEAALGEDSKWLLHS